MTILFRKKQLVIPGDVLAEGDYVAGRNVYEREKRFFATKIGLADIIGKIVFVIPLEGCYMPSVGDFVIGTIVDIGPTGWLVDINCPYLATLPLSEIPRKVDARKMDLSRIYNIGDVVRAKIAAFSSTKGPILTTKGSGLGKAVRGRFIKVMPTRIPRIIGRKGSMIELLKKELECRITIGQNGVILLSGKNRKEECLALSAIRKIEAEAHTKGLTNRVSQYIKARKEKYG